MATLKESRFVSWWIYWRTALLVMVVLYVAAFFLGRLFAVVVVGAGLTPDVAMPIFWVVTVVVYAGLTFLITNFVVSRAIGRKFGTATLRLVPDSSISSGEVDE